MFEITKLAQMEFFKDYSTTQLTEAMNNALGDFRDTVDDMLSTPAGGEAAGVRYIVTSAGSDAITAAVSADKTFTVAGDSTSTYVADVILTVKGSTGNDGNYTVVSSELDTGNTVITVSETVANETADGTIYYAGATFNEIGIDNIVETDGSDWTATAPSEGMTTFVADENVRYTYVDGSWERKDLTSAEIALVALLTSDGVAGLNANTPSASDPLLKQSQIAVEKLSTTFDVDTTTLNADDGTGINVAEIDMEFDALITGAYVFVSQGCGDAGDTLELHVSTDSTLGNSVAELISDFDCSTASDNAFVDDGSTLQKTSSTNKKLALFYKDVGNDDSASAALQGTVVVTFIRL